MVAHTDASLMPPPHSPAPTQASVSPVTASPTPIDGLTDDVGVGKISYHGEIIPFTEADVETLEDIGEGNFGIVKKVRCGRARGNIFGRESSRVDMPWCAAGSGARGVGWRIPALCRAARNRAQGILSATAPPAATTARRILAGAFLLTARLPGIRLPR